MKPILFIFITLFAFSGKAQTLPDGVFPLDKVLESFINHTKFPEGTTYIKDVNHLLDKYEGTWEGQFDGKTYKITFTKRAVTHLGLIRDMLIMRYKIMANGRVLINTLEDDLNSDLIVEGWLLYPKDKYYSLRYFGRKFDCGQNGKFFIHILEGNPNKMKLKLVSTRRVYNPENCPTGKAKKLFPVSNHNLKESIILTKTGPAPTPPSIETPDTGLPQDPNPDDGQKELPGNPGGF